MKKMSILFENEHGCMVKDDAKIREENLWVLTDGIPTRKFDGSACMIKDGYLYKRYDAKIDRKTGEYKRPIPDGAIPCQEADLLSGHHPHWIECQDNNPADKYFILGYNETLIDGEFLHEDGINLEDGTYELCGEKVNSNREKIKGHKLIKHGCEVIDLKDLSVNTIKEYLLTHDIEGIVFHNKNDDRMCKIRKTDFGIKR